MLEDFVPADPREMAFARLGDGLVRLFPGSVERPMADVDRALLVADAVDDVLLDRLGFGVQHLLEVALHYSDEAIRLMAPAWPQGELPGDGPVILTQPEVRGDEVSTADKGDVTGPVRAVGSRYGVASRTRC